MGLDYGLVCDLMKASYRTVNQFGYMCDAISSFLRSDKLHDLMSEASIRLRQENEKRSAELRALAEAELVASAERDMDDEIDRLDKL